MGVDNKSKRQQAYEEMLMIRGVKTPCKACSGFGVQSYGNTSTWRHGIGGQAVTNDICDKCWGSGDSEKPWFNLKKLPAKKGDCEWRLKNNGDHSYYDTECGEDYMFIDGGPVENLYNFCPNCGRKIKQELDDAADTKVSD